MTRWLSISFDDGLHHGAQVACEILGRYGLMATFYVVTGWVAPMRAAIREPYNAGCHHGDWSYWRSVRDMGHEVGSHTFSHINAGGKKAALMPWRVAQEIKRSHLDLVAEVPQNSYTISMPWNASTARSENLVKARYSACRLGGAEVELNDLNNLSQHQLASWAPVAQTTPEQYRDAIARIAPGEWLILQFHSFDREGWDPLSPESFENLCKIIANDDTLRMAPVARVIEQIATGKVGSQSRVPNMAR